MSFEGQVVGWNGASPPQMVTLLNVGYKAHFDFSLELSGPIGK